MLGLSKPAGRVIKADFRVARRLCAPPPGAILVIEESHEVKRSAHRLRWQPFPGVEERFTLAIQALPPVVGASCGLTHRVKVDSRGRCLGLSTGCTGGMSSTGGLVVGLGVQGGVDKRCGLRPEVSPHR